MKINVFDRVTLQSLRRSRTRTAVTIIGIILSAAMICAVTTFIASLNRYMLDDLIYDRGDWYLHIFQADRDTRAAVLDFDPDARLYEAYPIGYVMPDTENDRMLAVFGCNQSYLEGMPIHLLEGRLPETDTELLLSEMYAPALSVGSRLTLPLSEDFSGQTPERTVSYTVVGRFQSNPYVGNTFDTSYDAALTRSACPEDRTFALYVRTESARKAQALSDSAALQDTPSEINRRLLAYRGVLAYGRTSAAVYGLAAIVVGIIMVGSVALIYNAFSISISERTRQYGLLISIGATRRQIRRMVLDEALFLSIIGIPIGAVCGIAGIGATLYLLRNRLDTIIDTSATHLTLHVSWLSVLAAAAIGLFTVLLSAYLPSRRAMKISPIEAIRQNADTHTARPGRASDRIDRITKRLFGLPGLLSRKYFRNSRKKYRATVLSLSISVILFISANALADYLTASLTLNNRDSSCDVTVSAPMGEDSDTWLSIYRQLSDSRLVRESTYYTLFGMSLLDDDAKSNAYWEYERTAPSVVRVYFEDTAYKAYLRQEHIDRSALEKDGTTLPVLFDTYIFLDQSSQKYRAVSIIDPDKQTLSVKFQRNIEGYAKMGYGYSSTSDEIVYFYEDRQSGEMLELSVEEGEEQVSYAIGARAEHAPFGAENVPVQLIYPFSALEEEEREYSVTFCFSVSDHLAFCEMVEALLKDHPSWYYRDIAAARDADRNMVMVFKVFSYGFIVLISLISIANVFNTLTTNIRLRKRDFAMLKSIGMPSGGFQRMMVYECLLYGLRALALGLPVSMLLCVWMYHTLAYGLPVSLMLPWHAIGLAVCSIFAIVLVTMLYALRKINLRDPVEALKTDII